GSSAGAFGAAGGTAAGAADGGAVAGANDVSSMRAREMSGRMAQPPDAAAPRPVHSDSLFLHSGPVSSSFTLGPFRVWRFSQPKCENSHSPRVSNAAIVRPRKFQQR